MNVKTEQFSELQRKNLDAAMHLAQMSIENSQRIMELQVQTAKSLFEESVQSAKALAGAQDPKQALELRTQYAQSTAEKMLTAARQIAQIATETQSEFGRMMGQHLAGGSKEVMDAMQKFMSFNPAGQKTAEVAMGSLQQAIDAAHSAFEQITRVSTDAFTSFGSAASKATGMDKRGK